MSKKTKANPEDDPVSSLKAFSELTREWTGKHEASIFGAAAFRVELKDPTISPDGELRVTAEFAFDNLVAVTDAMRAGEDMAVNGAFKIETVGLRKDGGHIELVPNARLRLMGKVW